MTRNILILTFMTVLLGVAGAQGVNITQFERFTAGEDAVVLGIVENNSQRPVTAVELTAHAYRGDELLSSSVAGTFLDVLLPGQSSPFMVTMPGQSSPFMVTMPGLAEGMTRYQLELQAEPAQVESTPNLNFAEQDFSQENGVYSVTGTVRNDGTQAAERIWVVVSGYDAEQRLVAVEAVPLDLGVLEAGEEAPFTITFDSPFRPVTRVFLQLQSQAVVRL